MCLCDNDVSDIIVGNLRLGNLTSMFSEQEYIRELIANLNIAKDNYNSKKDVRNNPPKSYDVDIAIDSAIKYLEVRWTNIVNEK